jgi:hypothetical protein
MREDDQLPNSEVNIGGVSGDLAVGGDVVGRDKIVSSLTINQFVGGQVPLDEQLKFFAQHLDLNFNPTRFASSQFEAYCNAWRSLQAVRLAGEELWEKATAERIVTFSAALKQAALIVGEGKIFFEPHDLIELRKLLKALGWFRRGKGNLVAMRSLESGEPEAEYYERRLLDIQTQIEENRLYKAEYEQLLERIRFSFRSRLMAKPQG